MSSVMKPASPGRPKDLEKRAAILDAAENMPAQVIVAGAYTHSRAREWLLGGVTEYLMDEATMPVLLTH